MKNFEVLVEKHDEVMKSYEDFHIGEGTQEAWNFALEELERKIDKMYDFLSEEEKEVVDSWYEK